MYLAAIDLTVLATKTAQFILSFSIIVVLHELGHFIPARIFGARVEKFYLFFNPGFSLWKKKIGDTEYGLGWIPFGGYVKISGMIDESMDKEQMNKAPESYELRSKPAYQRLIVMLGGVIVNVILAIVIFIGIAWFWGDDFLPAKNLSRQSPREYVHLQKKNIDNMKRIYTLAILNGCIVSSTSSSHSGSLLMKTHS